MCLVVNEVYLIEKTFSQISVCTNTYRIFFFYIILRINLYTFFPSFFDPASPNEKINFRKVGIIESGCVSEIYNFGNRILDFGSGTTIHTSSNFFNVFICNRNFFPLFFLRGFFNHFFIIFSTTTQLETSDDIENLRK